MPTPIPRQIFDANARNSSRATIHSARIKAAQRDLYVLVGVFLGILSLMTLAIALSAAIMLAGAG